MSNKITINIDNQEITAEKGKTVLEIARDNDIEIPTMCHNDQISRTTSCFVCVVKDKKSGQFIPSCSAVAADGMEISSEAEEVREMRQTAFNLLLSEHTGDCEAPCTMACPAHASVEEYVRAGKNGNHREALKIIKERIPLPMSIGRVCPRFCEDDCRRNIMGEEPVAINDFKRLAADLHYEDYMEDMEELKDKKVAIVGAGPAGYSIAYFLRLNGIGSDLYEKMPKPGGMLRYGIPEYRLPKETLDKELAHFEKMGGINVYCNKELGENIELEELKEEYDAVAISVGSWRSSSMYTEGEELALGGIEFLEEIARNGWDGEDPGKTLVVGGGNTAMDCVRTSIRLTDDSPVQCLYRRTEKEMPAEQIEIDEAKEEGVEFKFLTQPVSLRKEDGKMILTCVKMELGELDASGRRKPIPIEGSEFEIEADTVIAAIGQKTNTPEGVKTNQWGDVAVDEETNYVQDNIFAAGDCVTGPATVVEAVAAARKTALSINSYLNGTEYEAPYTINVSRGHWQSLEEDDLVFLDEPVERERTEQRLIDLEDRKTTFEEVSFTFTEEEIAKEGERCIECSCTAKADCSLKEYSEEYQAAPDAFKGEKPDHAYDTSHQDIVMDPQKCIKCASCVKVCSEVVNEYLLGFKNRGYNTKVGTAFDKKLPESCSECGECIEICPVGALDWKDKAKDNA